MAEKREAGEEGTRAVSGSDSFTMDDLMRAFRRIDPAAEARAKVCEADEVEVRSSDYLPKDGQVYVMDLNAADSLLWPLDGPKRVMVLHQPEHKEAVRRWVDDLRRDRTAPTS